MTDSVTDSTDLQGPRHVAVIMDGNGRWAESRSLPRAEGHRRGVRALHELVEHAARRKVRILTVFAFSSENWRRPAAEVSILMELFAQGLARWSGPLSEAGVRLRVIGDRSAFSERIRKAIESSEAATASGKVMTLNIAANYGGRWDLVQAAARAAREGLVLDSETIERFLATGDSGDVDLLIRTGGEQRISNFLLWQSAYAEIYFTDTLWPDFDSAELDEALLWYRSRERRFGMTSEQVRKGSTVPLV